MHWSHAGIGLLVLTMTTGCPSEFGKDGRLNKAAHRDTLELVKKHCSQDTFNRYCSGGRLNTPECIRECG